MCCNIDWVDPIFRHCPVTAHTAYFNPKQSAARHEMAKAAQHHIARRTRVYMKRHSCIYLRIFQYTVLNHSLRPGKAFFILLK